MTPTAVTAGVALAAVIGTASADTITVCASGCDYTSINAAITAADDGDVIQLAAETYFEGAVIDTLGKAITLRGSVDGKGNPASTLDGVGVHRVLQCQQGEPPETVIENLVIRGGRCESFTIPTGSGAGLHVDAAAPTILNCRFYQNWADYTGGGAHCSSTSTPMFIDCSFEANKALGGGGLYNNGGVIEVRGCTFTANIASAPGNPNGDGGALQTNAYVRFEDCTFAGNWAASTGGAMIVGTSGSDFSRCRFLNNSAAKVGGVARVFGRTQFLQCEIIQNTSGLGGCIFVPDYGTGQEVRFVECDADENQASEGSVVYCEANATIDIDFSRIRGNFATSTGGSAFWLFESSCTATTTEFCANESANFSLPENFTDEGGNTFQETCQTPCLGDLNLDEAVDSADIGLLIALWGTDGSIVNSSDLNSDGLVNAADLGLLIGAWGDCG